MLLMKTTTRDYFLNVYQSGVNFNQEIYPSLHSFYRNAESRKFYKTTGRAILLKEFDKNMTVFNLKASEKEISTCSIQGVKVSIQLKSSRSKSGLLDIEISNKTLGKVVIPDIQVGIHPNDVNQAFVYNGVLALHYLDRKVFYKILTLVHDDARDLVVFKAVQLTAKEIINAVGDSLRPAMVEAKGVIYGPNPYSIHDATKKIIRFEIKRYGVGSSTTVDVNLQQMWSYLNVHPEPRINDDSL